MTEINPYSVNSYIGSRNRINIPKYSSGNVVITQRWNSDGKGGYKGIQTYNYDSGEYINYNDNDGDGIVDMMFNYSTGVGSEWKADGSYTEKGYKKNWLGQYKEVVWSATDKNGDGSVDVAQ